MNAPSASQLVDVFVVLLPAVAQAAIAWQQRRTRRGAAAERAIARWLPHPGIPMALSYALGAVAHHLLREPAGALPSAGRIAASVSIDVLMILGLAGYVHLARNQAHPEAPPGRRWLAVHYGVAVALCLLAATFPDVIPLPIFAQQQRAYEAAFLAYYLTSTGRILGFLVGPSGARPGVAPFALGMALAGGGWVLLEMAGAPKLVAPLVAAIGLAFAVPFAAGRVQRLVRVMLGVAGAVAAWRVARAGLDALAALAAAGQSLAGPPPLALATAGVSALLGLAWSTCARRAFRARERAGTSAPLAGIVAVLMVCMALFSALNATCWLFAMPALPVPPWLSALYFLHDWTLLAAAALVIHLALLLPGDAARPTARQVAFGYAVAGIVAIGGVLLFDLLPSLPLEQRIRVYVALQNLYIMAAVTFVVSRMVRLVRPGRWRPNQDLLGGGVSWSDVVVFGFVVAGVGGWMASLTTQPPGWQPTPLKLALTTITGTAALFPVALRSLGEVVRVTLGTLVALALAVLTWVAIEVVVAPIAGVGLGRLAMPLAAVVLALVFVPLQAWSREALERVVFRRTQRRGERLQAFLHELPPELGALECSRRAVAALVDVLRCPGGGVLLDGGEAVGCGTLTADALRRGWPPGSRADARVTRPLLGYELATLPLPLRETLPEAGVVAVLPLRSPRRDWGHLVLAAGLLATAFGDEDLQVAEGFADQLALILDTTELLERAVSVERSLAHAEKLAAVGETAARIAHDIRNPVTAARSLAQQLARAPQEADGEVARVIVEELDRIEHHVSALLRFARREEFRFEAVDLGSLVRGALEPFLPRLRAAEIDLELDAPVGIVARADAERMRQVLANLIENALAALQDASRPRRLVVAVAGADGVARVRVADSGPGVPADALPRLFEPFFSLKPTGTGLGLAIAKRTLEAHGGRITAVAPSDAGLRIDLEVPLTRAP